MEVFVALNSQPDYTAAAPAFKSVHASLHGAIDSLYPDKNYEFTQSYQDENRWIGPDGFGMVRRVTIQP